MNSLFLRSNSYRASSRPPAKAETLSSPRRPRADCQDNSRRDKSPEQTRPKSTLGFASGFARSCKASLASSTHSTQKSPPFMPGGLSSKTPRRTAATRPITLDSQIQRNLVVPTTPTPTRMRPSIPLPVACDRALPPTPRTPKAGPSQSEVRQERALSHPETPKTWAIHDHWREAARGLEGLAKQCLLGAVCVKITDPLDGIRALYLQSHSPRKLLSSQPAFVSHLVTAQATFVAASATSAYRPSGDVRASSKSRSGQSSSIPSAASHGTVHISSPFVKPSHPKSKRRTSPTPSPATPPFPSPTPLSRRPLAARRTIVSPKPQRQAGPSSQTIRPKPAIPVPAAFAQSDGITPRSARRVRNSLRMTPLSPEGFVPLKPPAPSPIRPASTPGVVGGKAAQSLKVRGQDVERQAATRDSDGSLEWQTPSGTVTPALRSAAPSPVASPWQVVSRSSSSSTGPRSTKPDNDADWVVTSPFRRSIR